MMVLQEISYATAKKKKGMTVGFVTFQSVEQLTNAVQVIVPLYILSICLGV
jgi:tRNA (uracil-5-)-methyltransferase